MAHVIQRSDVGQVLFYSAKKGLDMASPMGGWVETADDALQFARKQDADHFMGTFLRHYLAYCSVESV